MHMYMTSKHLCTKYEASRANGIAVMALNKNKQIWLPNWEYQSQ